MTISLTKRWLLPILSGLLLGSGFLFPVFRFAAWVGLIPLFFFLDNNTSLKKSFWAGFLTGFVFFGQVLSWFFDVLAPSLVDIRNGALSSFLVFLLWLVCTVISASFIGFFSLSYRCLRSGSFRNILLVPSLWVVFEYLRVWMLSIFMAGPQSLFGPHWTLGSLGYSLAQNTGLRSLAGIGGLYFISFLIIFINALFFFIVKILLVGKKKVKIWCSFAILLISVFIVASYFFALPVDKDRKNQSLTVAVLQTKFSSFFYSSEETVQTEARIQDQLLEIASQYSPAVDIVLFPEGANLLKREDYEEYLSGIFGDKDVLTINSGENEEGKFVGIFYSAKKGFVGKYEKRLLLPYGDYLPYTSEIFAKIINGEWLKDFKKNKDRKKGTETIVLPVFGKTKIGLLFCSEAVSPSLHREFALEGSEIFLNSGSLAFAEGSKTLDSQTRAMLQLRAAENGRYLVRATNYGSSYIINDRGDFISVTDNFENQVIFGEVRSISQKTFYTKYGDWILIVASLLLLAFLAIRVRKKVR